MHGTEAPSAWVQRWTHLIPPQATALDLACGAGRHMRWLQAQGLQVTGVDRSPEAIAACAGLGELICADIENGPWPLPSRQFGAVVVTNYLWRPLLPAVLASLAPAMLTSLTSISRPWDFRLTRFIVKVFVMITSAVGTSAIILLNDSCLCFSLIFDFICGLPSVSLNSSLISCFVILVSFSKLHF